MLLESFVRRAMVTDAVEIKCKVIYHDFTKNPHNPCGRKIARGLMAAARSRLDNLVV